MAQPPTKLLEDADRDKVGCTCRAEFEWISHGNRFFALWSWCRNGCACPDTSGGQLWAVFTVCAKLLIRYARSFNDVNTNKTCTARIRNNPISGSKSANPLALNWPTAIACFALLVCDVTGWEHFFFSQIAHTVRWFLITTDEPFIMNRQRITTWFCSLKKL